MRYHADKGMDMDFWTQTPDGTASKVALRSGGSPKFSNQILRHALTDVQNAVWEHSTTHVEVD